jgi:hypothetical protein
MATSDIGPSRITDRIPTSLVQWVTRYRPYIAVLCAAALLVWFVPGKDSTTVTTGADGGRGDLATGSTVGVDSQGSTTTLAGGAGAPGSGGANGGVAGNAGNGVGSGNLPLPAGVGPDCDLARGRIKLPALTSPPCQPVFSGSNGGSTYQGIDDKFIKVVYFQPETDPAVDAALTAAGANNTAPEQRATFKAYVDYFNHHYELFGRKVKLINRAGSGDTDDDAVAKADAIKIATEDKAFAVVGAPGSTAFAEELAARHVLCICTVSQPQEFYQRLSPYVGYTTLMASTQGYIHRAEYIGKRLRHNKAQFAGTSDGRSLAGNKRVYGLLYYETPDFAYRSGVQFFQQELKSKYGVTLRGDLSLSFPGTQDLAATQEEARPFIQKLKQAGVTSIIFSGDPISPAIFTREATKQLYFPEWIITGSALTDTTLFARTYDPQQWRRAFGISFLAARAPEESGEPYVVHEWEYGRPPTAANQYAVIYAPIVTLFSGLTMAGPNLTPQSFQSGLFRFPPSNSGLTIAASSFGQHGRWPFVDYLALDDVTEIWWDTAARGEDEVGNNAVGMYRYVAGGKRYLPGQHPTTNPPAFNPAGTVTVYPERPAGETPPNYPRPK